MPCFCYLSAEPFFQRVCVRVFSCVCMSQKVRLRTQ